MATRSASAATRRSPAPRSFMGEAPRQAVKEVPAEAEEDENDAPSGFSVRTLSPFHLANKIPGLEKLLKREEADVILLAGNLALVAFEVIEWPVAALTLLVHALARTRFKALEAIAEVAEEAD